MKIGDKEVDLGTLVAVVTAIVGLTIYLTTIKVQLSDTKERIASLERGGTLEQAKKEAITKINQHTKMLENYQLPVGTILPFYGAENSIPSGFLICNGDRVTKTMHPRLFKLLSEVNPELVETEEIARLPDLRGVFLRGMDLGRGLDLNRKLGSFQESQLQSHKHPDKGHGHRYDVTGTDSMHGGDAPPHGPNKHGTFPVHAGHADLGDPIESTAGKVAHGKENRPVNIAVIYIVKY